MMKTVITYGTFDLFHIGHARLLRRARCLGDRLIVAVSTDQFNDVKGKRTIIPYAHRAEIVASNRYVDQVIPEESWEQKRSDILRLGVSVFVIGDDWRGRFDDLSAICDVVYLPRTEGISSSHLKHVLNPLSPEHINELKNALEVASSIADRLR